MRLENNTVLQTSSLSIGYKSKKEEICIATNLNLNFQKGKIITLIGSNGIGKSTLLKTISGIIKPLSGTVFLNQKDIQNYNAIQLAQNLSLVLTDKIPASQLTVFELIALGRQPHTNWVGKLSEIDIQKINEAIALTKTEHLRDKKITEISDGQLQIALITRVLAQDTSIIILDEPTTHLDLVHRVSVFKLLKKIAQETQKCIILSTHDIDLALQLADEMVVFLPNKVIHDTTENLIKKDFLNQVFNDENVIFDSLKKKFIFTQDKEKVDTIVNKLGVEN
jgi:iron complex transport system ATP-binding protein